MPAENSVAIIGLGSRGLGVLERILTLAGDNPVRVVVVDPDPTGAGVHQQQQPDYLLLNTICSQVTMFPDEHTVGEAIGQPGPSLHQWVLDRDLRIAEDGFTVGPVGRLIRPTDFLPRRILGDYLAWFFELLRSQLPEQVQLSVHRAQAVDLSAEPAGQLRLVLSDGTELTVDQVFLTTGYTGNRPAEPVADRLIDEPYPMPDRLDRIEPDQQVAIGGFGLSAMDAMSCLTVGRGGRFVDDGARLRYLASGAEPRMLFYSRTGLPCRARPRVLEYGPRYQPMVFSQANLDAMRIQHGAALDFQQVIWPMIITELRIAYRRWQARTDGTERQLADRLEAAGAGGRLEEELHALDVEHGAFDPRPLLDPSGEMALLGADSYQGWLAELIRADLAEGELGLAASPVKATLDILRDLRDTFRYAIDFGGLTASSLEFFLGSVVPLLNRAVVGPQFERHAELLALIEAGIAQVPFGPAPTISRDAGNDGWLIESSRLAIGHRQRVDWLLHGRVGLPSVAESASPLLDSLYRKGMIRPLGLGSRQLVGIDIDRDQHPVDAAGRPDRRIWVLGPLCEGATFYNNLVPSPGGYCRPIHDAHRCVLAMLSPTRQLAHSS